MHCVSTLIDQNISFKVPRELAGFFPLSKHVSDADLMGSSDLEIWKYCKKTGLTLVTFDTDFLNIATLNGFPPKIILLKTGNRKTAQLIELFKQHQTIINEFLRNTDSQDIGCLEITG